MVVGPPTQYGVKTGNLVIVSNRCLDSQLVCFKTRLKYTGAPTIENNWPAISQPLLVIAPSTLPLSFLPSYSRPSDGSYPAAWIMYFSERKTCEKRIMRTLESRRCKNIRMLWPVGFTSHSVQLFPWTKKKLWIYNDKCTAMNIAQVHQIVQAVRIPWPATGGVRRIVQEYG